MEVFDKKGNKVSESIFISNFIKRVAKKNNIDSGLICIRSFIKDIIQVDEVIGLDHDFETIEILVDFETIEILVDFNSIVKDEIQFNKHICNRVGCGKERKKEDVYCLDCNYERLMSGY